MTVADSPKCVAYYLREKRNVIDYAFTTYPFTRAKDYVIHQVDKAEKTRTQKRIRKEIEACASSRAVLNVVDRVINHGEQTIFTNYD